jgi:hypothetical protein
MKEEETVLLPFLFCFTFQKIWYFHKILFIFFLKIKPFSFIFFPLLLIQFNIEEEEVDEK